MSACSKLLGWVLRPSKFGSSAGKLQDIGATKQEHVKDVSLAAVRSPAVLKKQTSWTAHDSTFTTYHWSGLGFTRFHHVTLPCLTPANH